MERDVLKAKVCLVGEASVGKTSLVRRFVRDEFSDRYVATLGAKVTKREVDVPLLGGTVRVVLTVWDVMGEPSFRDLLKDAYFHGIHGILAVADVTRPDTLAALPDWIGAVRQGSRDIPLVILGNKADLPSAPGVGAKFDELAASLEAPRWETSAKTGANVETAFGSIAQLIVRGAQGAAQP